MDYLKSQANLWAPGQWCPQCSITPGTKRNGASLYGAVMDVDGETVAGMRILMLITEAMPLCWDF